VRLLAANDDLNIHPPLVAELNLRRAVDDRPFRLDVAVRHHVSQRIVPARLSRRADHEK
jgi:hypothetical protein